MTIKDEILAIANQLANQGQSPTVAKVKSKLSEPTPLPTIINTLKSWQHQPEKTSVVQVNQGSNSGEQGSENIQTVELSGAQLAQLQSHIEKVVAAAIKPLQEELAEIKALLKAK
ncbi:hypothetical protein DXX93_07720 [Thalassotalea euphylliae]|uniref:Uncharacterized protein n=1 Tax=Thalassotalea euphylliae TaxID=1655234 RepID=A0A3E0TPE4_9GAMM|nr:hypothetical protein [Thalassotalea euphylliae]REL26481.1 hypothetical protein DXX93_07720 [Thalassotalea euphylliae]